MTCSSCGHEPPAGSIFCNGCGAKLALTCARCGATPPPGSRFCNECGATLGVSPNAPVAGSSRELQPAPIASGARKVVTILFADLAGSTALHERLDPESVRSFMESYYRAMRAAIAAHGGTLVKLLGDGVMAAFGVPHVTEDDAIRAVHAAVDMQQSFRTLAREHAGVELRVAINTGEVVVGADNTDVVGDPVNVAARLQQEARGGDVVIGETTRRLVATRVTLEPLGSFALRGRAEQVRAWRLMSLERPTGAAAAAFVGRVDELGRINAVYEDAVARPAARLAVLLGSPGLGKSRLIDEMVERLGETTMVLAAHCDAAGGTTFAPIAAAVRKLLDAERGTVETVIPESDTERTRIAAGMTALLAGSPASPEETFFVIRRFLMGLAQAKPVVLVIDDLQWAEPLLLDLVEHLVQWGTGVPLLVLVAARPELRDVRSSLVTRGGIVADVVTLGGLDAGAAMRLAANVIGATDLPAAVAAKVLSTSEGNPLFVGELVRMLVDQGAIERQGDRWMIGANLAALEMPPTIHALLAARIERLRSEERAVLEHASVVGRHFSRSAVAALLGRNGHELDARLEALRRTELIEPDTGWFLGEPVLRFHHVLIRDAAYRRLLKGTRAALHAQLADWIETKVGDDAEHDEIIGRHLEQAHQLLRELGALDDRGRKLGARAAVRLAAAGRRALAGDDVPLAANLLGRAIERLEHDDPTRAELALDWCEALLSAGDVGEAKTALAELRKFLSAATADATPADEANTAGATTTAKALGTTKRLAAWHTCFTGQLTVLTAPQRLQAAAESVAAAAQELAALGDSAGEAKAHFVHALALARLGEIGGCEAALDRALAAARGAGDRRRANTVLAIAPIAALWGPSPVTRASGRCLDVVRVLRITQGAPAVEAVALSCQGVLEALRGRTEAARRMIASARKMVEELGITQRLLEVDVSAGLVALLEGDASAAERDLRRAYEGLRDLGLGIDAARAAALLARALLAQDRVAEAETLSYESEQLAGDDLKAAIAWRGARAEALARRGEHAAAIALASKAVELAAATDALLDHADSRLALAASLRAAGRHDEADAEEHRGTDLWVAKGATFLAERAHRSAPSEKAPADAPSRVRRADALRHRVRPNAATRGGRRLVAAMASRDPDALLDLFDESLRIVHHPTGVTYGRREMLATWRSALRAQHVEFRFDPMATLGDTLALSRQVTTVEGLAEVHLAAFGRTEVDEISVLETDERGRFLYAELFAPDRLGDAVTRLYELYAERRPEGPERARAGTIARHLMLSGPVDAERTVASNAPGSSVVDHRVLATWSVGDCDEQLRHWQLRLDLAPDLTVRCDDVLALELDALLVRNSYLGTWRESGGAFEHRVCVFARFGPDGLITTTELFEAEQEPDALARFDELRSASPVRRRVRPNLAIRHAERFAAAVAARDVDAFSALFDESLRCVHHPTGATWGLDEAFQNVRGGFTAERLEFRRTPLGTLGHTLALERHVTVIEGLTEDNLAGFGLAEIEEIAVIETNERGQAVCVEIFAPDRLGDAITCLFRRYADRLPDGPERTRASTIARNLQLSGPIDLERMAAANAPSSEQMRHWRLQLELAADLASRCEDVLALEPHALLVRSTFVGTSRESGGSFENRVCMLFEFGSDGLVTNVEAFEAEQDGEALARFDALTDHRATVPPPEAFANAASNAFRAFQRCWRARDWRGVVATYHPAHRMDDRRRLMRMEVVGDAFFANERVLFDDTASEWRGELLATRGERLALFRVHFIATIAGSGPMEVEALDVVEVDAAGLRTSLIVFDPDESAAAYAELDARCAALTASDAKPFRFANAASATTERVGACIIAHDWQGFAELFAENFRMSDRRRHVQLEFGRDGYVAFTREVSDGRVVRREADLLATRGERLSLTRSHYVVEDADVGPSEIAFLMLEEVDERGRIVAYVRWDVDDVDAAYAELDRRYEAGEGADYASIGDFTRAVGRRDGDTVAAFHAADFVEHDSLLRFHHMRQCPRGSVWYAAWQGWREGGRYELPFVGVSEFDEQRRPKRSDYYDPERIDEAFARFRELCARAAAPRDASGTTVEPTLATVSMERAWAALDAIGMDASEQALQTIRAHCIPEFVWEDRRRIVGLVGGLDLMVASMRERLASGARHENRTVGTAGNRVLIERVLWVAAPTGGRFEVEYLAVHEVNQAGLVTASIFFDTNDLRAAQREAWGRWATIEPVSAALTGLLGEGLDAFNAHDRPRFRALLADDLVVEDRRLTGVGQIEGADDYVESLELYWDLAPDQHAEVGLVWHAYACYGGVTVFRQWGTLRDGGAFESECVMLFTCTSGVVTRFEFFDLDELDVALARFEELRADSLRIPPNAATRAHDRWSDVCERRDWQALPTVYADDVVLDDRRPLTRNTTAGRDTLVENARYLWETSGGRVHRTTLAVAGDRFALEFHQWCAREDVGEFAVDVLELTEVDEQGRVRRITLFDPSDRAAANTEMLASYVRVEGGNASMMQVLYAWNTHDAARLLELLPADFYIDDRRRTGVGLLRGAKAWVESLLAVWNLSPDIRLEALYTIAEDANAVLYVCRWAGRYAEGSEFETVSVTINVQRDDMLAGLEVFELEDMEIAKARFGILANGPAS